MRRRIDFVYKGHKNCLLNILEGRLLDYQLGCICIKTYKKQWKEEEKKSGLFGCDDTFKF